MIKLNVESYCETCEMFDPVKSKSYSHIDESIGDVEYKKVKREPDIIVTCKDRKKCQNMMRYMLQKGMIQ